MIEDLSRADFKQERFDRCRAQGSRNSNHLALTPLKSQMA